MLRFLQSQSKQAGSLLVLLLFSLCCCASAKADVIWENEFVDEDPITNMMTVNASMTTLTFMTRVVQNRSSGGPDLEAVRSASFFSYEAGTTGNHFGYLEMTFDNKSDDPEDFIELTINFSTPVTNLQFSMLDVDGSPSGQWDDGIEVFYNGMNTKPTSFRTLGPAVFLDNEAEFEGYEGGNASTGANSTDSNVDFDFGTEEISSLTFRYLTTDDAIANPGSQFVGLSDLTFTAVVPESNALFMAGLLGCARTLRRRRRVV